MQRRTAARILALAGAVSAPLGARADDCAPIVAAYEKLAAAPAYRQSIKTFGQPPADSVAIGDTLYMSIAGAAWESLTLKPGARLEMMKSVVGDAGALKDCAAKPDAELNGVRMKVYAYQPPEIGGRNGGAQTLWVGAEDGLPRRMSTATVDIDISYDDVKPPKAP